MSPKSFVGVLASVLLLSQAVSIAASRPARADSGPTDPGVAAPAVTDFVYFVSVKIKPDQVLNYKNLSMPYIDQTRQESGNVAYLLHQSPDDSTEFAVYEHWQSAEARSAHLAATYTVQYFAAVASMFEPGYPIRTKFIQIK